MSDHEVWIRACCAAGDFPGDYVPGLEVICTCGQVLIAECGEISLEEAQEAAWEHYGSAALVYPIPPQPCSPEDFKPRTGEYRIG